jgi:TATA-box binding protein (TBP) (component of TFIID and TFIIIB)
MNIATNIDDEWNSFITKKYNNNTSFDEDEEDDTNTNTDYYVPYNDNDNDNDNDSHKLNEYNDINFDHCKVPEPTNIYISTKSKIAWLKEDIITDTVNNPFVVDLDIFWKIKVIPYSVPQNGIIKKQIKLKSKTAEELAKVQEDLKEELYYEERIIKHIDNPKGRIKFKDTRKITVGISKKDIMSCKVKKSKAFYNCFAIIIRLNIDNIFKEFHVKVFNTGKVEIPGVQNDNDFETVLKFVVEILQPFYSEKLTYKDEINTVLINSNFNCGFYINRDALFDILINKYNIQSVYDPCSYPGIKCTFYYNTESVIQTGIQLTKPDNINNLKSIKKNKPKIKNDKDKIMEVSFMIFRTGSALIVGNCDEQAINVIYNFLTNILKTEFKHICKKIIQEGDVAIKDKNKKPRRKTRMITIDYVPLHLPNNETILDTLSIQEQPITTLNAAAPIKQRKKRTLKPKIVVQPDTL